MVKQFLLAKNNFKFCVFGNPLSEPVAPPGTAWGAEGLRGNVANENKIMVLALAQARKWQSASPFAQEAMDGRQWSVVSGQWSAKPGSRLEQWFGSEIIDQP
jgi:hypothetical protein